MCPLSPIFILILPLNSKPWKYLWTHLSHTYLGKYRFLNFGKKPLQIEWFPLYLMLMNSITIVFLALLIPTYLVWMPNSQDWNDASGLDLLWDTIHFIETERHLFSGNTINRGFIWGLGTKGIKHRYEKIQSGSKVRINISASIFSKVLQLQTHFCWFSQILEMLFHFEAFISIIAILQS